MAEDTFYATEAGHCGKPRPDEDKGTFIDEVEDSPDTWDEKELMELRIGLGLGDLPWKR